MSATFRVALTVLAVEDEGEEMHVRTAMEYPTGVDLETVAYFLTVAAAETSMTGFAAALKDMEVKLDEAS